MFIFQFLYNLFAKAADLCGDLDRYVFIALVSEMCAEIGRDVKKGINIYLPENPYDGDPAANAANAKTLSASKVFPTEE